MPIELGPDILTVELIVLFRIGGVLTIDLFITATEADPTVRGLRAELRILTFRTAFRQSCFPNVGPVLALAVGGELAVLVAAADTAVGGLEILKSLSTGVLMGVGGLSGDPGVEGSFMTAVASEGRKAIAPVAAESGLARFSWSFEAGIDVGSPFASRSLSSSSFPKQPSLRIHFVSGFQPSQEDAKLLEILVITFHSLVTCFEVAFQAT